MHYLLFLIRLEPLGYGHVAASEVGRDDGD